MIALYCKRKFGKIYINTKKIKVFDTGLVQIGTESTPAINVTIYLDHVNCELVLD